MTEVLRQKEILYVLLGCIALTLFLILLVLIVMLILLGSCIGVLLYEVSFKRKSYDSAFKLLLSTLNFLLKFIFEFLLKFVFEFFKNLFQS